MPCLRLAVAAAEKFMCILYFVVVVVVVAAAAVQVTIRNLINELRKHVLNKFKPRSRTYLFDSTNSKYNFFSCVNSKIEASTHSHNPCDVMFINKYTKRCVHASNRFLSKQTPWHGVAEVHFDYLISTDKSLHRNAYVRHRKSQCSSACYLLVLSHR